MISPGENIFLVGDLCKEICIITQGLIDIIITDGEAKEEMLDFMGRGSVCGSDYVLNKQKWPYSAVNKTCLYANTVIISYEEL